MTHNYQLKINNGRIKLSKTLLFQSCDRLVSMLRLTKLLRLRTRCWCRMLYAPPSLVFNMSHSMSAFVWLFPPDNTYPALPLASHTLALCHLRDQCSDVIPRLRAFLLEEDADWNSAEVLTKSKKKKKKKEEAARAVARNWRWHRCATLPSPPHSTPPHPTTKWIEENGESTKTDW